MVFEHNKKWAYFLPNTFTCLNMACGFASVMLSMAGDFYKAALVLILGAIFDSVDGRVARLTGTQSSFGEQFDSMGDLISFGLAPAMLFYHRFLSGYGKVGMVISFIFLLCGALRLARFNATINKISSDYFQGLPIPLGALALVGHVLLSLEFQDIINIPYFPFLYILFYSVLMISNIPFYSFKRSDWVRENKKKVLLLIFLTLALIVIYEELMVVVFVTTYVLSSISYFFLNREKLKGLFDPAVGGEHD